MTGPAQVGARGPTAGHTHPPSCGVCGVCPGLPAPAAPVSAAAGAGGGGSSWGYQRIRDAHAARQPRAGGARGPCRPGITRHRPGRHAVPCSPLTRAGPRTPWGRRGWARSGLVPSTGQAAGGSGPAAQPPPAPPTRSGAQRPPRPRTAAVGANPLLGGCGVGHRVVSPALPGRPPEDPLAGRGRRPCHAHPSQAEQGAGLPVPSGRRAPAADPPSKGSPGRLSRSSQRRPPAPRPLISSE